MNNSKKVLKYLKNILIIICSVLFVTLSIQGIQINRNHEYVPNILSYTYLNVLGNSMSPTFNIGDLVIGKSLDSAEGLEVGDVITYRFKKFLVTHRIEKIEEENGEILVTTKGDNNEVSDLDKVKEEQIVAKYSFRIPYIGMFISKFQNFMFLAIVWGIVMYYIIKALYLEVKKSKKKASEERESKEDEI